MPIYIIDIACRNSDFDYSALFGALRKANAQSVMDARWMIDVWQDLTTITSALLSHCAPGDGLFVVELAPETRWSATGVGDQAKAWFAARSIQRDPPIPSLKQ